MGQSDVLTVGEDGRPALLCGRVSSKHTGNLNTCRWWRFSCSPQSVFVMLGLVFCPSSKPDFFALMQTSGLVYYSSRIFVRIFVHVRVARSSFYRQLGCVFQA